ncbi:MAG: sensor histidine kinase [Chloroflexi bacterium]|nr:sensor histidine kinase [Chloroflexota bacterium]
MTDTELFATVDVERLLPEIPRFFPSFESILGEILQNAHRSGATEVRVLRDAQASTLTIRDNGTGLDKPERLLRVGDAGWDASLVIDPAGMGAFATLRPEFVQQVVYESRGIWNWRLTVTPEVLAGAPALLSALSSNGASGLAVTLHLTPQTADVPFSYLLRQARGFYPFRLTFENGDGQAETISPHEDWEPDITLQLPQGSLQWHHHEWRSVHRHQAVWEYRPIESEAVAKALATAARMHACPQLAHALTQDSHYRWFIDPACGVRPKLPDRNEILDDPALHQAARHIVDALVAHVLGQWREISCVWPDRFRLADIGRALPTPDTSSWMAYEERLARHLFPLLGWKRVEYLDPASTSWYARDDGDGRYLDRDRELLIRYDRTALAVASEALNLSLNLQGTPASLDPEATDPPLAIRGLRADPDRSPFVALAGEIRVGQGMQLPWLLAPDLPKHLDGIPPAQADLYRGQPVIFAGSVQAFLRALYEDPTFVNMIALEAFSEDFPASWERWQDGEPEFDENAARATIALQVTEAYSPNLLSVRRRYFSLGQVTRLMDEAVWAADPVVGCLTFHASKHKDIPMWLLLPLLRLAQRGLYLFRRLLNAYLTHLARRASVPS